jgi:hypothetical protein
MPASSESVTIARRKYIPGRNHGVYALLTVASWVL